MKTFMLFVLILMSLNNCTNKDSLQKQTQVRITSHKEFIRQLSFSGRIIDKKYCNECNYNKFQIIINFNEDISEVVHFSNLSFPPYYWIALKEKTIIFSVNKNLYESCDIGMDVTKKANLNFIVFANLDYPILSTQTYQWIP
ncbi:hypothetical protein ACLI09_02460 [Flavobacterium sp. RHBU_24]|uniref:hypothetical protein n=1 Tax=Flavobacterium sp. RHBU_24 TaxID=3391185 RepID=UPI00398545C8